MEDIFEDMFDEADAVGRVDTGTGKQLSQLVRNLRTVENDIEEAETHLKALKQEKHKLSVENIPALMDEMGVERLDVDGVTVERKMIVAASIPVANKATLLQETNHVPRYVVFSLTKRAGHIVLDDVIKVVVTQPVKRLIFW